MTLPRHSGAAPTYRLRMLGGLSLLTAAGSVASHQRRRLGLLALLASARTRGMSRDRLVALLSPESTTESARHSLHQLLYYLRQQVGDDAFVGTDPLRLDPAIIDSDVVAFEDAVARGALLQAEALYAGPFLDGFHLNEGAFEEWVASERARLAAMHRDVIQRLAAEREAAGDHDAAIVRWRQLAALDPLSGRVALGLMRALAAAGDATAAAHHGRLHASFVFAELGTPADPRVTGFATTLEARSREPVVPDESSPRVGRAAPTAIRRIALLPLRATGTDAAASAIAEGLTREMISALTAAGVTAIGYRSVASFAARGKSIPEMARALEVDAIATGRIEMLGSRVAITVEVADGVRGSPLWSTSTQVDAGALASLAAQAAGSLAGWLVCAPVVVQRAPGLSHGANIASDAYASYLMAMQAGHRGTATDMQRALELLEDVIVKDSTYAPAYAGLGFVLTMAVDYGVLPADEAFRRAGPVIARALALDPANAIAHLANARLLQLRDWDWRGAEAEYRTAIALEPGALAYQTYGWFLEWYVGRAAEGVAMGERAVLLDPASAVTHLALAWRLRGANQLERAAAEARIGLALDSSAIDGYWILAEVSLRRGDYVAAELEARRYVDAGADVPANNTTLGEILARTGRMAEATAYGARLALRETRDGPSLVARARMEMALGNGDLALALLEQAVRMRIFTIPFQPYWDPIREDPRFQAIVRAQGLEL